ncbi:hypothetical protein JJB98_27530 [Bradyrhizobium diazoefficiens]|nr:hypothetical protein [Bradyrhizobium diazoefficiens]QQO23422.1 hypothetical protein JJB98_27530 [Bradyrhizobium diazoefficiens]
MLNGLVDPIDRRLRVLHSITEFTGSRDCIFHMQLGINRERIGLQDGTVVDAGARILILHLWNEHILPFPPSGPGLGWARRLSRQLEFSLRELDLHITSRANLQDVPAIRADMALAAGERAPQLLALAAKYGFEPVQTGESSLARRMHRLGENILIAMLVVAHNPRAFRIDTLRRSCTPIFVSRAGMCRRLSGSCQVPVPRALASFSRGEAGVR